MNDAELKSTGELNLHFSKDILLLVILGVVMLITNPTKQEYISWVKDQAIDQSSNTTLSSGLMSLFADPLIDSTTKSDNYLFITVFTTNKLDKHVDGAVIGLFHHFIPLDR